MRDCQAKLQRFLHFCEDIGVPISPEKTEGPSSTLTLAGIELDCLRYEARLPQEKIDKCIEGIKKARGRNKITLRDLQSLTGSLNFACSVIVPGRVFLRQLAKSTPIISFGLRKKKSTICTYGKYFSNPLMASHFS